MLLIKETAFCDLENLRKLWADGEVMKFVGFPNGLSQTAEQMKEWYEYINKGRPQINHFSIFDNGRYCGETFYEINPLNGSAALDVKLFPFSRGRGIASTALKFAIKQAFGQGAISVWVDPNPKNEKALALYNRLGFTQLPFPEDFPDSEGSNSLYYELKKQDFLE